MHSTIIKQLDASRRIEQEFKIQRHQQQLQKQKINVELESLKRSRKQFIDSNLSNTQNEYASKLKEDPQVTRQHLQRKKKSEIQRSKIAQIDFEKEREELFRQRKNFDNIEKDYRMLDTSITELKNRSKFAYDSEQRRIIELQLRRKQLTKLLGDSKQRELIHYNSVKVLNS